MKRHVAGFTLIELMITVAIIGILARIAIPSYTAYIQKGSRGEAKAKMLDLAQMEERFYSNSAGSTVSATYQVVTAAPGVAPTGWPNFAGASTVGSRKYSIGVTVPTANTYLITATPINGTIDPVCGTLTLDQDGARTVSAGTVATCW